MFVTIRGDDDLVTAIAGYFVNQPKHYEYVSYYNRMVGKFEINAIETRTVKPVKPNYDGKLAILINQRTGSSGEGLPIVAKGLPNVRIIDLRPQMDHLGLSQALYKLKCRKVTSCNCQMADR